jgi:hypothetical protein
MQQVLVGLMMFEESWVMGISAPSKYAVSSVGPARDQASAAESTCSKVLEGEGVQTEICSSELVLSSVIG